ncbi:ATP-binding protein [Arthrobacter sp. OAP107]|uniref:sensor histidine kinase n=1 Tax=Arthrobacter sp. OAP107 TaxID=3156445 RepID=UPI0033986873
MSLYRATDEIFRNILAHAVARKVAVRLKVEPGSVRVCVQDDGVGFDRSPSGDATEGGLRRLQREVSLAGGYLDVQSRPGTGTFVIVQLPLE